jgi:2-polyprenyl-6-methoxyphenol hydroxylase-like FAD-dependent oxidoreductase
LDTPVLIVGGGPVGLALAADLGWRGIECTLIEQNDGTIEHPRANAVNSRSMEFCRRWGIAEKVRNAGAPPDFPPTVLYVTRLDGHEIARIERPSHGGAGTLPNTPERPQRCNQIWFDPILRDLAQGFPTVDLRYRVQFDSHRVTADGIEARVRNLAADQIETITARYIVACCGGHSAIPAAIGSTMRGTADLWYNLNIFIKVPELWTYHDKGKVALTQFVDPSGIFASLVEIDGNELWRLSIRRESEPPDIASVDVDAFVRRTLGPGIPYEVVSVKPWTSRDLVADKFQDGPVFLAGDAAHQNPPAGGFGMNTGLGDAADLGWKLAASVEGWGGPGLLGAYEAERRPVALRNVGEATDNETYAPDAFDAVLEETPAGEAARRKIGEQITQGKTKSYISDGIALGYRYDASPIVCHDGTPAPDDSVMRYVQTSRPGSRAPHAWLADGRSTLDLFGRRFVLLRFSGARDGGALVSAAEARGVPIEMVDIDDPDVARLYETDLVLVRPDGHVAWRGATDPEDALAVIDRITGRANGAGEGRG